MAFRTTRYIFPFFAIFPIGSTLTTTLAIKHEKNFFSVFLITHEIPRDADHVRRTAFETTGTSGFSGIFKFFVFDSVGFHHVTDGFRLVLEMPALSEVESEVVDILFHAFWINLFFLHLLNLLRAVIGN